MTEIYPVIATALGAVAALLSAGLATLGKRVGNLKAKADQGRDSERDFQKEIRLTLVSALLTREIERRQFFSVASGSLIFSQFIVGGVLASSFVIKTLGENLIGLLGLLVLLSSLINQQFRPDILRRASSEKLRRLRSLKRKLEDELYIGTRNQISDEELIRIRLLATKAIEEIEEAEIETLKNEKENGA